MPDILSYVLFLEFIINVEDNFISKGFYKGFYRGTPIKTHSLYSSVVFYKGNFVDC